MGTYSPNQGICYPSQFMLSMSFCLSKYTHTHTHTHIYIGEGNGNPLQYSCLGNPMDREAWWAVVHGVTKSWTRVSMHTQIHIYWILCLFKYNI